MDIRHSFPGYKISRPYFCPRAFTRVLELDALDAGLQMWHVLHDTKDKSDALNDERPKEMNEIQNGALRQGCGTGAEIGGCLRTGVRDKCQDTGVS